MTDFAVVDSEPIFDGAVIRVRRGTIRMPAGSTVAREIVDNPAPGRLVGTGRGDRIVMVNQYRPALRTRLDELPAGLLDVDGEAALVAAQRELAEEASLHADDWHVLLDLHTSPGFSDEAIRIFLARGLTDVGR